MMAAGTRSTENRARSLRELAAGVALMLAVAAALQLLAGFVTNRLSAALLGAFGVSMVAGAIGLERTSTGARWRGLVLRGAALGGGVVVLPLVVALALGSNLRTGTLGLGTLLGVGESVAVAYRDEVFLRGLPLLFARRAKVPPALCVLFAVATGVAHVVLAPNAAPLGLALVAASGLLFAVLWWRTSELLVPVAAHAAWRILTEVLLAGDALDLDPGKLPTSVAAGGPLAWATVGSMLVGAVVAWRWSSRWPTTPTPQPAPRSETAGTS